MPSGFGALGAVDFLVLLAVPFHWLLDAGLKISLAQRGKLRDGLQFGRILRWGWRCKWDCFLLGMVLLGLNIVCIANSCHTIGSCRPVDWFDSHCPCNTFRARVLPFRVVGAVS